MSAADPAGGGYSAGTASSTAARVAPVAAIYDVRPNDALENAESVSEILGITAEIGLPARRLLDDPRNSIDPPLGNTGEWLDLRTGMTTLLLT